MRDRIKDHIQRNRLRYEIAGAITIAGVTYFVLKRPIGQGGFSNTASFIFRNQQFINVIARDGRGHPGYPVICKETQDIFLNQGSAAHWAGVSARHMSRHIQGIFPDANGWTFERLRA